MAAISNTQGTSGQPEALPIVQATATPLDPRIKHLWYDVAALNLFLNGLIQGKKEITAGCFKADLFIVQTTGLIQLRSESKNQFLTKIREVWNALKKRYLADQSLYYGNKLIIKWPLNANFILAIELLKVDTISGQLEVAANSISKLF